MNIKKVILLAFMFAIIFISGPIVARAGMKVQVCHIPPGDTSNFHTITIGESALAAHLAHGDLPGSCSANAEALCDDGNACTIDVMDAETEKCISDHAPVNCDDSNLCTSDSCDPTAGCQYAPIICDDGDACTVDMCNPVSGECTASAIDCGPLGYCLPESGQCNYPCEGITCEPIDQCHEAGQCVLPGECMDGEPVADGTPCDDGNAETLDDQCENGACTSTCGAPIITNFGVITIASDSITFVWYTDRPATSQIVYRLATGTTEMTTPIDNTLSTTHQVNVAGLLANTDYVAKALSTTCGIPSESVLITVRTRR